jgi:hypothetical protein
MRSSVAPMTSISTYVACTVEGMVRRVVASRAWLGVSAISALAASLYWALIPTVHEEDVYGVASGVYEAARGVGSFHSARDLTVVQSQGAGVLVILAVPVVRLA